MRVDTDNADTVRKLIEENGVTQEKIDHQIALGSPIDLCVDCYLDGEHDDDVAHPTYVDDFYKCFVCKKKLCQFDD